ncbi:MAG: hypothetical protein LJF04_02645 [Gemmatimonadetes bacterium]|nr:hypothetical protein [Gemmatimonadota bacterium]
MGRNGSGIYQEEIRKMIRSDWLEDDVVKTQVLAYDDDDDVDEDWDDDEDDWDEDDWDEDEKDDLDDEEDEDDWEEWEEEEDDDVLGHKHPHRPDWN